MKKLRIAVVGCGSAGPAAAILLQRQGHHVVVFERAEQCQPVGAGFLLQPSGMSVLQEIGILDQILQYAAKIERLHVVKTQNIDLLNIGYKELDKTYFGAGLHRPVLLHFLIQTMVQEGVELHWGWEICQIERRQQQWSLTTNRGQHAGGFDLLIIADGTRSNLRAQIGFVNVDRSYPWGAHWFIGHNDGAFRETELYQVVSGTKKLAGFLATGKSLTDDRPLISLFWSIKLSQDTVWRKQPLAKWKEAVIAVCPQAESLTKQINDWSEVITARYGDVRMPHWHAEQVVILGDAGHAMSPQLGQGVNLALADAACLAKCLLRFSPERALENYSKIRRQTLTYYQFTTRQLTPWFQSDHEWLVPLRQLFFRSMQHIPAARRFMIKTMAGLVGH